MCQCLVWCQNRYWPKSLEVSLQPQIAKKEMTSRLSDVNLLTTFACINVCGYTSVPVWTRLASLLCKSPQSDADANFSVLATIRISDHVYMFTINSPWVFNQQGLDEVNSQGGNPLERVLRVVYVDLGDVEECLLLVITQEGRLACQHYIRQDPNAPIREEGRKGRRLWGNLSLMVTSEVWSKVYLVVKGLDCLLHIREVTSPSWIRLYFQESITD